MKILHLLLKNKPIAIYLFQTYREIEIDDGISRDRNQFINLVSRQLTFSEVQKQPREVFCKGALRNFT